MKKNILFINGHLNAGGCERSLTDLLNHLNYDKYNVDLLLLEEKGDYITEIPKSVHVYLYSLNQAFGSIKTVIKNTVKNRDWFSLKFRIVYFFASRYGKKHLKKCKKLFRKLRPEYDTIIAYRPGICTDLAAYAFRSQNKISWWHHGELNIEEPNLSALNDAYQYMDHIVAVSDSSAKILRDHFPNATAKITVIPNMIIPELLRKKSEEYQPFVSKDKLTLVSVGRMSPEKNMTLCPYVGEALKNKGIDFQWYLIGDGEDYQRIETVIRGKQLENCFILTGRLANPYPYIKSADILIHPSLVESQGITVLEGMALGTPVVVVKSAGPSEFIKNGTNGILVDADCDSVAAAVLHILQNEHLKTAFINNSHETIKYYSAKKIMSKIEKEMDL